jgi:hypothetical protein
VVAEGPGLTGMHLFDRGAWTNLSRWLTDGRLRTLASEWAAAGCLPGGDARHQVAAPRRNFTGVNQNDATEH